MRNKFVYSCNTNIHALGFNKLWESIFCILLVVEVFSLQKAVEKLEEVIVSWWKFKWIWWLRQNPVTHFVQLLKCWLCDMGLGIVFWPIFRGRSREDLTLKGWWPTGSNPPPTSGAAAEGARLWQCRNSLEELPPPKARGGGQEEWTHVQGTVAAWVLEGLEELFHVQGREGQWWGDTPHPR